MTRAPRRLAAMYGITRGPTSWSASIVRNGKRYRKAFVFGTHGGADAALLVAQEWRDRMVAAYPSLPRREKAQRPRADTKEGTPGIFCRRGVDGMPTSWVAHTHMAPGKILRKAFSVAQHGDQAKCMAIAERMRQLEQLHGVVTTATEADTRNFLEEAAQAAETMPDGALKKLAELAEELAHRKTKSEVVGVVLRMGRNAKPEAWIAQTRVAATRQLKIFSISKYGDAQAKALAIAERQRQLKQAHGLGETA